MSRWPVALVTAAVAFAALLGWSVWKASQDTSPVSDPAYYARGLHHDRDAGTAWRMALDLRGADLRVQVRDAQGNPITGADVRLHLRGPAGTHVPLGEEADGMYATTLPPGLPVPTAGTLRVAKDGALAEKPVLLSPGLP